MTTEAVFSSVERESQAQVNDTEHLLSSLNEARTRCAEELKSAIQTTRQYVVLMDALDGKTVGVDFNSLPFVPSELKRMWQEREAIHSQYQLQFSELQSRIRLLEMQRSTMEADQGELSSLKTEIKNLENNLNEAEAIKNQFEKQRQALEEMKKAGQQRAAIEQDIQDLNVQRQAIKEELERARFQLAENQKQSQFAENEHFQLEKRYKESQAELENYESLSMRDQSALNELQAQLDNSESERNVILGKEQMLREQVKRSEGLISSYTRQWQELKDEKKKIEKQMAGLEQLMTAEQENIRSSHQQIEVDNVAQLNALLDRVQFLSSKIDTMAQTVIQGKNRVEELRRHYLQDFERKTQFEKDMPRLAVERQGIEKQVDSAERRLSDLQSRYEALYARLASVGGSSAGGLSGPELEAEFRRIADQIAASEKTLSDLKGILVTKKARWRELETAIRSFQSLAGELESIQSQLLSMETKRLEALSKVEGELRERLGLLIQNALQREASVALRFKAADELEKKQLELLKEMKGLSLLHVKTVAESTTTAPVLMNQEAASVLLETHRKRGQDEGAMINDVMDYCSQYY